MTLGTAIILAVNAVLLIIVVWHMIRIIQYGSKHNINVGDDEVQAPLRYEILKSIVWIVGVGILAAIFNLAAA